MTDKKDKLLEEMVFQHNKQIAELKAENEKLKSQFNNSFMLDWAKRQQNKKWTSRIEKAIDEKIKTIVEYGSDNKVDVNIRDSLTYELEELKKELLDSESEKSNEVVEK